MRASCGFLSLRSLYSGNSARRFWIQQRWTCFPITCAVGAALFAVQSASQIAQLFGTELLTILGVLCVLLLLGLSAIGPVPIYLFTMLYGAGAGLLTFQLFSGIPLPQALFFLFISGIPAALAAGALCWFGSCALEVSGRLHAFSLGRGREPLCPCPAAIGTICTDRCSDASALRSRYLSCLFGQSAGRISVTVPCGHRRNVV